MDLDLALIKIAKGDMEALEDVYNQTRKGVFNLVLPMVRDYYLAEDVTEQTYVLIYERAKQYQKGTSPINWILTIAKNLALKEIEKNNREIVTDFQEGENSNLVFENAPSEYDTPITNLANQVLSPEEYQILMLHAVSEYKHREIADILNIPLGTVTWKYNEAVKKLKQAIKKGGYNFDE